MNSVVVKVIEYKLAKGTKEKDFLSASAALMPEIKKLKGFIKRELHKGEHGRWHDVVYWKTRKDADRSEKDIPNLPACMKCIALMDHRTIAVAHFDLVQSQKGSRNH